MSEQDLLAHLAGFANALRARRVRVGLSDEMDAAVALTLVDLLDRDEVRCALRTALKIRRGDWTVFDEEFRRLWVERGTSARPAPPPRQPPPPSANPAPRAPLPRAGVPSLAPIAVDASASESPDGEHPGYSPDILLRRKPFDECTARELAELERLLERLSPRLATRPSRNLVPTRGRGFVDMRRSFRRAIGTRGDFISLARRARAVEEPKLVLLCDTSGSMDAHSRFFLAFILALRRVARRTEAFAFNTTLTRLTPWLTPGKIGVTLDRLAAGVPDWSGGTRIGESLTEFVWRYQHRLLDADTVVVILSDGLDRGDPDVLVRAMRAIRARARRVIWLNPLLGDARYQPLARGMEAALPFVDHFAAAHNLESLEAVSAILAA